MSYQALARKWRPRSFASLVGQDHVKQSLMNALAQDRLHHAFLFTGTRGVGKTTIARIFAKAINCEQGVGPEPCGECSSCKEIDAGRFIDLIEVDAASRTGVDDTRDLLENVQYAPTRGRFKVYIIDEVHMFSKSSFNALLKTLEEPPSHVKFMLATTDPQKIPVTVLSRCLQFHLRPLSSEAIAEYLQTVIGVETVSSDQSSISLIARAAAGSMRDGLSLLDQAIAYSGGNLTEEQVRQTLGLPGGAHLVGVLEALLAADGAGLMALVAELSEQAPDFAQVLEELLRLLHTIAVLQAVPESRSPDPEQQAATASLASLASRIEPETLQLYYQVGLIGRRDLPLAADPRSGFEMVLLRMLAFQPDDGGAIKSASTRPESVETPSPRPLSPSVSVDRNQEPGAVAMAQQSLPPEGQSTPLPSASDRSEEWHQIVNELGLSGMALELARNLVLEREGASKLVLTVAAATAGLMTERGKKQLDEVLRQRFGPTLKVEFRVSEAELETPAHRTKRAETERQLAAEHAIEHDDQIRDLRGRFDGQIEAGSIQPVKSQGTQE